MGEGFQFFDIILLAMIAGFLILRLRSVLGRRDGHEGGFPDPFDKRKREDAPDNVVHLPDRATDDASMAQDTDEAPAEPETPLDAGITQIQLADPSFTAEGMVSGARIAFEMILGSYAEGDAKALEPLLSPEVLENFSHAIREREENEQTLDLTLVSVGGTEVVEAYMEGRSAHVTIKFVSEQISVLRDAEGEIVDGDPNQVTEVTDFWTFARDTRSRDPNWSLVATGSLE